MSPEIRPLTEADIPAACVLASHSFGMETMGAALQSSFIAALTMPDHHSAFVAEMENSITGYILCRHAVGEGDLISIAIHPDLQGKGLGHTLMEASLADMQNNDVKNLFLEVRVSNTAARKLYERLGGQQISIRKNYYSEAEDGKAEDAAIYRIILYSRSP